ncbi:hypothetical protein GBN33_03130 [Plesiomonas shigelloides]|uniref:hypothetical protein n=1 Tax=Plesiomonas shigelloides TaxID=703 RepID=UPI0012627D58|nr:hypothetical protein [Plesiomonas shigelloides]KAB7702107.1 hypothetical protein GBN33_03130 [Plesiomonas shigelloides]
MTSNNTIIEVGNGAGNHSKGLVATLPKEHLKSLFYLFAGKPDSRIKVFEKSIFLCVEDVIELNACITRKLQTNRVEGQITTVTISYKGSETQEFGTWDEFINHHWQESDCVEEVVVKWDFMLKLDGYEIPQRHTLLVRVSADIKPGKYLQMIASGNSDEFDQFDVLTAPAFCRVDFINSQISKELINQVSDWFASRREPALIPDKYYWFKQRRQGVAEVIHNLFPLMYSILWITALLWINKNEYSGKISMEYLSIWIFSGFLFLTYSNRLGLNCAKKTFASLKALDGHKVAFEFTSGDKKKNAELLQRNKAQGWKFVKEVSLSMILNIIAGLIATYLYVHS